MRRADVRSSARRLSRRSGLAAGLVVGLCAMLVPALPGRAEPGPHVRAEIDQLLMFIRESDCRFVRNGREYGAERAYRHVLRKFRYFEEQIESAEDFIDLAASRSTVSGRSYRFVCSGEDRESAAVLHEALRRLRAGAAE